MNTKDRIKLAISIVGLMLLCGLSLFGLHLVLTKLLGANVEESVFILSASSLLIVPEIIMGMILRNKRKHSNPAIKSIKSEIKNYPKLPTLLDIPVSGVSIIALWLAFQSYKSNESILWIILYGLVVVLSTLWLAKRSWSRNLHLIFEGDKRRNGS